MIAPLLRALLASCCAAVVFASTDLLLVHDSTRRADPGQLLRFQLPAEVAPEHTALRVELHSLSGDADLYVGPYEAAAELSFENYAFKSTTFGTELVEVPARFPRPVAIAVFAAGPLTRAEFRLRVFLDRTASLDDFERARMASQAGGRSYEECAGVREAAKPKTGLPPPPPPPPPPPLEEKSSWILTLLFHLLELFVEVLL